MTASGKKMSQADFRSELMGGLNAPLGVEDSRTASINAFA
jgi:hypothetical protein